MRTALHHVPARQLPEHQTKLMQDIVGIIRADPRNYKKLSEASGVGANTMSRWVAGEVRSPRIGGVAAVLAACGYDLTVVSLGKHN